MNYYNEGNYYQYAHHYQQQNSYYMHSSRQDPYEDYYYDQKIYRKQKQHLQMQHV